MDAVRLIVTIADDLNIANNEDYIGEPSNRSVFLRNAHGTEVNQDEGEFPRCLTKIPIG